MANKKGRTTDWIFGVRLRNQGELEEIMSFLVTSEIVLTYFNLETNRGRDT
jgi:hypothetical protein